MRGNWKMTHAYMYVSKEKSTAWPENNRENIKFEFFVITCAYIPQQTGLLEQVLASSSLWISNWWCDRDDDHIHTLFIHNQMLWLKFTWSQVRVSFTTYCVYVSMFPAAVQVWNLHSMSWVNSRQDLWCIHCCQLFQLFGISQSMKVFLSDRYRQLCGLKILIGKEVLGSPTLISMWKIAQTCKKKSCIEMLSSRCWVWLID